MFLVYVLLGQMLPYLVSGFWIATLALIIPITSLTTRRLHDIGKSGWWQVLFYAPMGFLFLLNRLIDKGGLPLISGPSPDPEFLINLLKIQIGLLWFGGLVWTICALLGIIFLSRKGNVGPNRYGLEPRQTISNRFDAEITDGDGQTKAKSQYCDNCKVNIVIETSICESCELLVCPGQGVSERLMPPITSEEDISSIIQTVICENCGREKLTKYCEFRQNIGLLVMRIPTSVKGPLCTGCIHKLFWRYTLVTVIVGWWGIISVFVTPFVLLSNVSWYLLCLITKVESAPIFTTERYQPPTKLKFMMSRVGVLGGMIATLAFIVVLGYFVWNFLGQPGRF